MVNKAWKSLPATAVAVPPTVEANMCPMTPSEGSSGSISLSSSCIGFCPCDFEKKTGISRCLRSKYSFFAHGKLVVFFSFSRHDCLSSPALTLNPNTTYDTVISATNTNTFKECLPTLVCLPVLLTKSQVYRLPLLAFKFYLNKLAKAPTGGFSSSLLTPSSVIHLGRDLTTGQQVAVKVIDLRRYDREFDSEVRVLALLHDGEGIVQLKHSQVVRDTGYIYMDYIPFPNLYNYVKRNRNLPQERAMTIFWHILSAVETIHAQGIAHRDLKPDNIMVDPNTLRTTILDFGLSMVVPASGLSDNFCGSKQVKVVG